MKKLPFHALSSKPYGHADTKKGTANAMPRLTGRRMVLHQVFRLACGIASLLAIRLMAQLAVLEDASHLDSSAPAAQQGLGTGTMCVLRYCSSHIIILQKGNIPKCAYVL